jgi:hypothetical protein
MHGKMKNNIMENRKEGDHFVDLDVDGNIILKYMNFSLCHRVQNGSGVHPASYPMGTRGSFPGCKDVGA